MSGKKTYGSIPKSFRDISPDIRFMSWTPEMLKKKRNELGLTQSEIAAVVGVTNIAVGHIERGVASNPWAIQLYGIILERYEAAKNDYIPGYRKIGTNEFLEG